MCSRATNLYVAVREVAERMAPLAEQIERDLNYYNRRDTVIPAVRQMLETRKDGLALELFEHLVQRIIEANVAGEPLKIADLFATLPLPDFPEERQDPEQVLPAASLPIS